MSAEAPFELHPQLAADTRTVGDWPLSRVLLMNDAQFPWLILVPRRSGLREIFELPERDQQQLLRESSALGRALLALFPLGEKLNIGALGNLVPQLHVHHIVRWADDAAWPAPVWGRLPPLPYADDVAAITLQRLRERLAALMPLSG
ncbi:HIT domain-containing protein [Solimonas terrae]|uniref:HIT family protein n=1 Tax=Solimonas terrae TaxID=1396819 RepID=A0A6M2BXF1_9GAMM|nr:HIT family protein [Solimonas terrae]NGY06599.1 HIT family protein [Solimonas terrae]